MTRRSALTLSALVSFFAALAVYVRTLAPDVALIDSGELTLAAARWGIPHPPGFPLWVVLTHWFTLFPLHTVAWRTNFSSAVYCAVAAAMMSLLAGELMLARFREIRPAALAAGGVFAGLLLAFARTPWGYATLTEVYALNLALTVALLAALMHWRRVRSDAWLYVAAVLFGAALGVHHVTSGLLLPAVAFLVIHERGFALFRSRQFFICFALAVAALALAYAYEPLASRHRPPIDWGGTSDARAFFDHVTGKQYRRDVTSAKAGGQVDFVAGLLSQEFAPKWFPLALLAAGAGVVAAWKRDRTALIFLALVIAANLAWVAVYPILDDQDAYCLPTIVAICALAALGAASVARADARWLAATVAIPIVGLVTIFPLRDRSEDRVARHLVENVLRPVKANGLVLSNFWNFISPFTYLQPVENVRPDVAVVTIGMLEWPWYLDQLERTYPSVMRAAAPQLAAFRPWAERWAASSAQEWAARPDWDAEYRRRYNDLVLGLATAHLAQGQPVYATRDFIVGDEQYALRPAAAALESRYDIVPLGVVAQYVPSGSLTKLAPLQLDLRGLDDDTLRWQPGDVHDRIVELYVRAYRMHGRFCYVVTHQPELADESYRKAMQLQPDNEAIRREMAKFAAGATQ